MKDDVRSMLGHILSGHTSELEGLSGTLFGSETRCGLSGPVPSACRPVWRAGARRLHSTLAVSVAGAFSCAVCGAVYKSNYSLQQHARVHEGRTLCPVCGVPQSRVTNLRRHLMIRHGLSRERVCQMVPMTGAGGGSERHEPKSPPLVLPPAVTGQQPS